MKFFGGGRGGNHAEKPGGRHAGKSRLSSALSTLPRWCRIVLLALLITAVLAVIGYCTLRAISRPPERPAPPPAVPEPVQEEPEAPEPPKPKPETEPEQEEILPESEQPTSYREGVYNILICGTDGDGMRTDTIMIANLNAETHLVSLVSIPRDTLIDGSYAVPKLNSSYAAGGVERLKQELNKLLGFPVDGYVVVDLEAFVRIVDLVGGVDFDVPQDMRYSDPSQDLDIDLKKGEQHLDGAHALQMVRYRKYANADITRIGVQQDFLRTLAEKCVSIGSLTKIGAFAEVISEYVKTDLTVKNMVWFGEELLKCDFDEMRTMTPEGDGVMVGGASCYALYPSSVLRVVNSCLNPYDTPLSLNDISVRPAPEPEPIPDTPEPEEEEPIEETAEEEEPTEDEPSEDPILPSEVSDPIRTEEPPEPFEPDETEEQEINPALQ